MTERRDTYLAIARNVIELLAEHWPETFSVYERHRKPLKIGIFADLKVALAGAVTDAELRAGFSHYARNRFYQARLITGAPRYGLDGQPAGTVEAEHAVGEWIRAEYRAKARAERRKVSKPEPREDQLVSNRSDLVQRARISSSQVRHGRISNMSEFTHSTNRRTRS